MCPGLVPDALRLIYRGGRRYEKGQHMLQARKAGQPWPGGNNARRRTVWIGMVKRAMSQEVRMKMADISGKFDRHPARRAELVVMASLWALVAILLVVIAIEPHLIRAAGTC